jgi:microcystin degradation protein MlrC
MRIALAGFNLESVSFLPEETTIEQFQHYESRGQDIVERFTGTNTVMGGFIDICNETGYEMVPIVMTEAGARGSAADSAFEHYARIITEALKAERGRLDGVLLHLHGAMTTPSRTDPDRDIAALVRAAIGPDVPFMLALDYHGNLDERSVAPATATFGYHYSPHVDMGETGRRAGRCLVRTLKGEIRPVTAIAKPGLMVPSILSATTLHPLADFVARSIALPEENPALVDVSVFAGFSYADVPNCGFSVVVVADGDADLAQRTARELSDEIFASRVELYKPGFAKPLKEGLDYAFDLAARSDKPVVVLEHADRMNDSTHVLRELVRRGAQNVAVPYLYDAESARQAAEAGAGKTIRLALGGKSDARAGGPVEVEAEVVWAGPKTYIGTGPMRKNSRISPGIVAVLKVGGITVSVTETPLTCIDEDAFIQFGMDARDFDVVVLRSKTHFRAVWEPLSEEIVIVDTPDWGPADLLTLPYRHVPRDRVYPFTEAAG